jgi:hypothetical protein
VVSRATCDKEGHDGPGDGLDGPLDDSPYNTLFVFSFSHPFIYWINLHKIYHLEKHLGTLRHT